MMLLASAPGWLAALLILILCVSAMEDLWRLQIEDWLSAGVAIGAALAAATAGPVAALWQNMLLLSLVLGFGTLLFASGWMGGGDVKLLAASALWFDLASGAKMLLAVAIAGGLVSLIVMALRSLPLPSGLRQHIDWLRRDEGVPYGVAIAAGVAFMAAHLR